MKQEEIEKIGNDIESSLLKLESLLSPTREIVDTADCLLAEEGLKKLLAYIDLLETEKRKLSDDLSAVEGERKSYFDFIATMCCTYPDVTEDCGNEFPWSCEDCPCFLKKEEEEEI